MQRRQREKAVGPRGDEREREKWISIVFKPLHISGQFITAGHLPSQR